MKFYTLATSIALTSLTTAIEETTTCKKGKPCHEVLSDAAAADVYDDGNGRRRRSADGTFIIKSKGIVDALNLDTEGKCELGQKTVTVGGQTKCVAISATKTDYLPDGEKVGGRFGLQVQIPVINNYGCWCYGGEYWPGARDWTGFGPFMDEYDDACKAHHQGFDCITLDAEAEGESCIPNETTYSLKVSPMANGDYLLECDDSIEFDWCKRRTCMVDLRFLARHWKLEDDGVEPDYAAFGHAGFHDDAGDFDAQSRDSVCLLPPPKGPGGHAKVVKVCCGDYPYRVWYDKANFRGIRCCQYDDPSVSADYGFPIKVGKLYNNMAATCCNYGVINDGNVC